MEQRKRVLIIDNSIAFTGALKASITQAVLMRSSYTYVFILPKASKGIAYIKAAGFTVYTIPFIEIQKDLLVLINYIPFLLINAVRLKKIIREESATIVVMNDFYNLLGATAKLLGAPVKLITFVRFLPATIPVPLRNFWISMALKKSENVIVVSDAVKNQLTTHSKIVRLYDVVDLAEAHPPWDRNNEKEQQLLYIGNFIRGKGQDYALKAFIRASQINPALRLTFIGGDMGLEKNRQFKEELLKEVAAYNLDGIVRFLSFERDTEKWYKQSSIFLNFSEAESFSMTCAEAAYYGIPTIATRCGGPEEIILHGKTGLLVENRNIEAMTDAILTLSADASLQQQFSAASRAYVREKFSAQQFVTPFKKILDSL